MAVDRLNNKMKADSPGCLTHIVLFVVAATVLYFVSTPEVTGSLTEGQERDFHVAAASVVKDGNASEIVAVSLAQIKAGKVDLASVSFLLPQGDIKINAQSDYHKVTVLERHADWQLVEYRFGNTHDSTSRYRAFRDRIEPISYRITADIGIFFSALVLLVLTTIVSAIINAAWRRVAGRKKAANVS